MDNTTGKRLARARSAAGLTQKQLGSEFDLDVITISRYERDKQPMSIERAKAFAARLGVTSAWLVFGEDDDSKRAETARASEAAPEAPPPAAA